MQRGTVQSVVIEGMAPDTCLIVIEEQDRSYVIVKGEDDNIVVALDDDAWAQLSMVAAAQKSKMSMSQVDGEKQDSTMLSIAIRDEMSQMNMIASEAAQAVGIDRASMNDVLSSKALFPERMNNRLGDVFGFSAWSVIEMQKSDRELHPGLKDCSPTYVSRVWKGMRR